MLTTTLRHDQNYDPQMVETLVRAARTAMEKASIDDVTTPSDILSAAFTLLSATLGAIRVLQDKTDEAYNTRQIANALRELLVEYGSLPN